MGRGWQYRNIGNSRLEIGGNRSYHKQMSFQNIPRLMLGGVQTTIHLEERNKILPRVKPQRNTTIIPLPIVHTNSAIGTNGTNYNEDVCRPTLLRKLVFYTLFILCRKFKEKRTLFTQQNSAVN